jgi:hypothetical protein
MAIQVRSYPIRIWQSAGFPRRWSLLCLLLCCFHLSANALDEKAPPRPVLVVTHKLPDPINPEPVLHEVEILRLALDKTLKEFGPYELRGIPPMNRARAMAAMHNSTYPNFILQMSYEDDWGSQDHLAYIPFPIERGALSYRICFMRKAVKARVKNATRIEHLKDFTFGTGIGWADTKVLRHNNLHVIEGTSGINLFRMTKAGRIDLFCRGPSEYIHEFRQEHALGLTSDDHLALYYPLPKFFFAHRDDIEVLNRIKKGLDIAYKDGSFNKLWNKRHRKGMDAANLKNRNIVRMENPLIKHLPRDYESYLYDPLAGE